MHVHVYMCVQINLHQAIYKSYQPASLSLMEKKEKETRNKSETENKQTGILQHKKNMP